MKKTLLAIALCILPVAGFAAQTPVTQIDKFNSAATKIDDVRVATNVRLAAAQSNFTEIYTALNGSPWLAQTTAPSIHNVFWLDTTGAPPTIKYWDGDSWEVAASGGDGTYTLPTATVGQILQADADGVFRPVSEIAGLINDAGDAGDDLLSAEEINSRIATKQDTLGTNAYHPYTAALAALSGNSKYWGTNSSGTVGVFDLPAGGTGTFAFDTYPTYEDSPHDSGIAVNGTTLAVYSATASKWLTVGLTDTLNAAPVTYAATLTITDASVTGDTFTLNSIAYDAADSPVSVTDLPTATEQITYTGNNLGNCSGDVTGTADTGPWTITDGAATVDCAVTVSATGCSATPSYDQSVTGTSVAWLGSNYNTGGLYTGTTSYNICSIAFHVASITGDISAKTFQVKVYNVSGFNLNTELGSVDISGSVITAGWNTVTFASPFSTGADGFAVIVHPPTSDGSNYFNISSSASAGSAVHTTRRWSGLTDNSSVSYDMALKIYE